MIETLRVTNSLHYCAADRFSLHHAFGFSAHVRRLYPALLNGGSVHLMDIKEENARALLTRLKDECITIFTDSLGLRQALSPGDRFPTIRLVIIGSQVVFPADIVFWRQHLAAEAMIVISYAITETGTVSLYLIDRHTALPESVIPVGYVTMHSAVLLRDENGDEVGSNDMGEICVKSRYLSPRYWRQPELTAAAFVSDPHGGDERVYRTGDFGRRFPDGCLMYLGRQDAQVKVKGYRIEIAEIEAALRQIEAVKQAVVVARGDTSGHPQLIADIVPDAQQPPTVSALRRRLAVLLPEYMVPARFVMLDALPRNAHDKIDRRALPAPGNARPLLDTPWVAPRTPVEAELARIWTDVLVRDQVGIHDPFLELGGHSLLATQLLSRVIETFQVELPLRTLLEAPTVAEMAVVIVEHQAAQADPDTLTRLLAEVEALADDEAQHRPLTD